jgi:hypothetical protein
LISFLKWKLTIKSKEMDKYTIRHPYLGRRYKDGFLEVEIKSDNIIYSEIGKLNYGVQHSSTSDNEIKIGGKLRKIADLIREIDILNNINDKK